jgi:hypothetical protein
MRWSRCLLTLFLFSLVAEVRAADEPVGMILLVQGEGRLTRGEAATDLSLGDHLRDGDVLEIVRGDVVMVFCPKNSRMKLKEGTTIRVGAENLEVVGGPEPEIAGRSACVLPRVALGSESLERMGALRPRGKPPIPVFLGGKVSTGRPLFEWAAVEGAEFYRVAVRDELGRVLWEGETSEPRREFPRDLPPLEEGWYSWEVNAETGRTILAQQNTGFEVIKGDWVEDSTLGDEDELLLRAFELEGQGYYAESAFLLRALESRGQESPRLSRRLAWLYWRAGLLPAFNREMERFADLDHN